MAGRRPAYLARRPFVTFHRKIKCSNRSLWSRLCKWLKIGAPILSRDHRERFRYFPSQN